MTTKHTKGRAVPPIARYDPARLVTAMAMAETHGAAMAEAARGLPDEVRLDDGRVLKQVKRGPLMVGYRCRDGMAVLASYDPSPHGLLLHISVSYASRDPTWRDLKLLRAAFFPDAVDVIQVLPRAGEFVNCHEHCFHLFQAPEAWQGGWNV